MRFTVFNGSALAGLLVRHRGQISFSYAEGYRELRSATPLSVSMPLAATHHGDRAITPWLWGLLPDNELVLERWAREMHTTLSHPLGLLARQGRDLPGAFRIVPEGESAEPDSAGSGVTWLSEGEVAQRLAEVRRDQTAWLGSRGDGRWSLAGAQAKIALRFEGGKWGEPVGDEPTTHILKPAVAGLDEHDLNEHLCLRALANLGIRSARTSVEQFEDERVIVVTRYDRARRAQDGRLVRVHQEDLCQAMSVHPSAKYEAEGGPTVSRIGELLWNSAGSGASDAVGLFADGLVVNWILGAPDAHAKNYSLLLRGRDVRMAPLYDVASALAHPDFYEPKIKMAMRIGGHYELGKVTIKEWGKVASQLRLDVDAFLERAQHLCAAMPDALADAVGATEVKDLGSELPGRLLDAVASRAGRCLDRLT
jgi:serine/threonine-protein kinase HipA